MAAPTQSGTELLHGPWIRLKVSKLEQQEALMALTSQQIAETIAFHGHVCPGVATGMRVAEVALAHVGRASHDEEVVAVVETANCAVDAIQFLVGCTLGKGSLVVKDYGRNRFTFARRSDGRAVRISARVRPNRSTEAETALVARVRGGVASAADQQAYQALWQVRAQQVLDADLDELFIIETLTDYMLPGKAVIEPSLVCVRCGLAIMACLTRQVDGRTLCNACWEELGARSVALHTVGVIRSPLGPTQPRDETGNLLARLELLPELAPALDGLAPGQRIEVLWLFDQTRRDFALHQHPRGDRSKEPRGLFALRTPHRPSPVALTTVTVQEITGATLVVAELDAWDGSPIVDIKPAVST
jgi:formylmethanofuran dehydrogenase subunit E